MEVIFGPPRGLDHRPCHSHPGSLRNESASNQVADLVLSPFVTQHRSMRTDSRLSLDELRALQAQVERQPADSDGTLPFLKDGMLEVISTAIAALEALEGRPAGRA